ncbi:hypothetical protein [Streptosporangium canum]|uniref:hypothetical protein n=1 Tax=Streptosporangium canum TaxID=324952 RepID=UPI0037A258B7
MPAVTIERLQDVNQLVDDHVGLLPHQVDCLIGRGQIDAAAVGDQCAGRQVIAFFQIITEGVERPSDFLQ